MYDLNQSIAAAPDSGGAAYMPGDPANDGPRIGRPIHGGPAFWRAWGALRNVSVPVDAGTAIPLPQTPRRIAQDPARQHLPPDHAGLVYGGSGSLPLPLALPRLLPPVTQGPPPTASGNRDSAQTNSDPTTQLEGQLLAAGNYGQTSLGPVGATIPVNDNVITTGGPSSSAPVLVLLVAGAGVLGYAFLHRKHKGADHTPESGGHGN